MLRKRPEFVDKIANGEIGNFPFFQNEWAIHEVLPILLDITGAADISVSSYNISDEALSRLAMLKNERQISNLRMILDNSLRATKINLLFYAGNISDLKMNQIHAKIMIIKNEHWRICIIGSGNLNNTERYEAGIISNDTKICAFFETQFENLYKESIPFSLL